MSPIFRCSSSASLFSLPWYMDRKSSWNSSPAVKQTVTAVVMA